MPSTSSNTPRVRRRFGKYRLERWLGQTDAADTFEATDTVMGHAVAVKILRPKQCSRTALKTFATQLPAITQTDHPGILRLQDASMAAGRLVLAMPAGLESLDERLARRMSADAALLLTGQLLDTMAYAHERRIVHGRLHARQVILFPDQAARISDFCLADMSNHAAAPNFRSDVAAVCRLILALFGFPLSVEDRPLTELLNEHPRPAARLPDVLVRWLKKALDDRSSRQFSTAAAMKAAFGQIFEQVRDELGCRSMTLVSPENAFPNVRTAA